MDNPKEIPVAIDEEKFAEEVMNFAISKAAHLGGEQYAAAFLELTAAAQSEYDECFT